PPVVQVEIVRDVKEERDSGAPRITCANGRIALSALLINDIRLKLVQHSLEVGGIEEHASIADALVAAHADELVTEALCFCAARDASRDVGETYAGSASQLFGQQQRLVFGSGHSRFGVILRDYADVHRS